MERRVCTQCGEEYDLTEFPLRNQFTERRQSYCKNCKALMHADWYERNKDVQKAIAKKYRTEYRGNLRDYALEYLSTHPCVSCGESDPRILEFHHARGVKLNDVSSLIGRGSSLEKLKEEIDKCDVYCANCHRKLTVEERGWFRGRK